MAAGDDVVALVVEDCCGLAEAGMDGGGERIEGLVRESHLAARGPRLNFVLFCGC